MAHRNALVLAAALLTACGGGGGGGGEVEGGGEAAVEPGVGAFASRLYDAPTGGQFGLLFVVGQSKSELDAYLVSCGAGGWTLPPGDTLSGGPVPINSGKFSVENADVSITGTIASRTTMSGTVVGKSYTATNCGIPDTEANWTAKCGAPTGISYLVVAGNEVELKGPC